MKKLIQTIKNIFKIEELRTRILYTLGLLVIYRLGSFIVLPGIDSAQLANLQSSSSEGLVGLLNMFSGGAFGNASIFALGVMPYISASIVIQLLGVFVPYFRKLQMEGESGRRKMNQYTRYLTIAIICIQGPAYMANLHSQIPTTAFTAVNQLGWSNFWFNLVSTIILLGGTMFVMWLGERITDRGIGNGISLIIMIGIIARLPHALFAEVTMNGGICVSNMLGLAGTNNVEIIGNEVSDNRYGIALYGQMNAVVNDNVLMNNNYESKPMNGGSGVSIYGMGVQNVYMSGNHIEGHFWGITNIKYTADPFLNLGNLTEGDNYNPGGNVFVNNGNGGVLYDLYNNSTADVMAQGNTWNVAVQDEASIEEVIFHKVDNNALGLVTFMPAGSAE